MKKLTAKKPFKYKKDSVNKLFYVDGFDQAGTFAVATNRKSLKELANSEAVLVYDRKKGKLYFNHNGSETGWGGEGMLVV